MSTDEKPWGTTAENVTEMAGQPMDIDDAGNGRLDVRGRMFLYVSPPTLRRAADELEAAIEEADA